MARIRYLIRRLSVQAMLSYAKPIDKEHYSFALTPAQTKSIIMGDGDTWQEDNAIFFQAMCILRGEKYRQPTSDMLISDLADVILYLDFKGIFDRDADNPKAAIMQKKTEAMFSQGGITLNFGQGDARYLAFERSGSMSRSAVLSFVRADIYEELSRRMTVGMTLGVCQLSKLYAYNGLLFSSGTRIETDMLWDKDAIVVIDNPTSVYPDVDVITVEDRTGIGDVRNYERVEKKGDVKVTLFDGEGILSPALAEEIDRLYCGKHIHTSFQIRMPYIKGMVHEVDFHGLFREATVTKITDLWGVEHPIERVRMILTKSQFKGCGWMTENGLTFEEYLKRLRAYRHTLYITGVNRTDSEQFTDLNYQFLSTLALSGEQFRPVDKPFDMTGQLSDESESWLTKTTEEIYYRLLNDEWFQFDYYVDHAPKNPKSRRYRLAEMLYRNDLLLAEKEYRRELDRAADTILQNFARGNLLVHGRVAYLSADLTLFLAELLKPHTDGNRNAEEIYRELLDARCRYTTAYGLTGSHMTAILRNPHIAKNEEVVVYPPNHEHDIRHRYLSHLSGVVMVEPWSLIAERLGGADYDGDMVKVIREPVICESIASHYKETANPFEDRFASRNNLPLLSIPSAEPQLQNANDLHARFEAVKSTFSSRVGQISNAAFDRSMLAYDESLDDEIREQNRKETETLAILTGLEIDSAKSGVKPNLSAYLDSKTARRSRYLKYKRLLEDAEARPAWYEDSFAEQMQDYIDGTDWDSVTANVEKLPYYAHMLKKHTPRKVIKPAPASELFTFARHENWKDNLNPSLFEPIRELIDTYDRCLRRIRSHKHPTPGNSKRRDIDRILTMRDQENAYDTDSLYVLFTRIDAARIKTVRDALRAEQWHFMKPDARLSFLQEYLPEEAFRAYDGLFSDFRMGGYRVFGDIICDIDDANRQADKAKLHYKHDTPEMTAMIDAYNNRIPGTDYREAVAETCRVCIAKITPPFQAIRYAEAMDRRDFIFDVLLEEAEFYLIGGGNG